MLCPPFRHPLSNLTDIFSFAQRSHPCRIPRILGVQILQFTQLLQQPFSYKIPGDKGQISKCTLVADEPPGAIPLKTEV